MEIDRSIPSSQPRPVGAIVHDLRDLTWLAAAQCLLAEAADALERETERADANADEINRLRDIIIDLPSWTDENLGSSDDDSVTVISRHAVMKVLNSTSLGTKGRQ